MENRLGSAIASAAMKILGFDYINRLYPPIAPFKNREFTEAALKAYRVKCDLDPAELAAIPKEGPFIVLSNHPFGGWDGIILYNTVSAVRPDFKIIANFILSYIPNLKDCFLSVNPFSENKQLRSSFHGLKEAHEVLEKGGCLGIFPAGEVSTYYGHCRYTADTEWKHSIMKLIRTYNVPIVPVYFDGSNSPFFHRIGRIHPLLRTLRLPRELIRRSGQTITVKFGRLIKPAELSRYQDGTELNAYLRNRVYALEANTGKNDPEQPPHPYSKPIVGKPEQGLIDREIARLDRNNLLFEVTRYRCYLAKTDEIPNIFTEIGRKREESFREVGEGTGKTIDTDAYDRYYEHLILWDREENELVGAYRLGIGKEIAEKYGNKGFYTHTLFRFSETFSEMLPRSIELGRSFLSPKYKKEALPLMLLIKGLLYTVTKYRDCRYLFGPASITSWYPPFYRSILIYGLSSTLRTEQKNLVEPRSPFRYEFLRVDPEILLKGKCDNIDFFDKYLQRLSNNRFRIPTLIKKYVKLNADILAYNVDKDFNYCVDGMILLDLDKVPQREVLSLTKGSEHPELLLERFRNNPY